MTARKMQREKEERQRRLSGKIGAALMAGSLAWTPGGPMSWGFVLGGDGSLSTRDSLCTDRPDNCGH